LREELGQAFPDVIEGTYNTPGNTGAFEVFVNEDLLFSKVQLGRFPNDGEIVNLIKEFKERPI
tara:strand:- start:4133 stop:4321 length:189 start_codon:yes stop_codon:yes gene_type:complete